MTDAIVRMYPSENAARGAAARLREYAYPEDWIFVVAPPAPGIPPELVDAQILAAYVLKRRAKVYAEGVRNGKTLLVVHAPFGRAGLAMDIMDEFGPVDTGLVIEPEQAPTWDDRAPLSSALGLPTLLRGSPAPLSGLFALGTKAEGRSLLGFFFGEIGDPHFSLSSMFGLPTTSRKAAPLSSAIGLPLTSRRAAPLSATLGLPLISRKAAPLSSLFGLKQLTSAR
jgi:hypothetical protein